LELPELASLQEDALAPPAASTVEPYPAVAARQAGLLAAQPVVGAARQFVAQSACLV